MTSSLMEAQGDGSSELTQLLPLLQHLHLQRHRFRRPALTPVGESEVAHRRQRIGVVRSQDPPALLQHLLL